MTLGRGLHIEIMFFISGVIKRWKSIWFKHNQYLSFDCIWQKLVASKI